MKEEHRGCKCTRERLDPISNGIAAARATGLGHLLIHWNTSEATRRDAEHVYARVAAATPWHSPLPIAAESRLGEHGGRQSKPPRLIVRPGRLARPVFSLARCGTIEIVARSLRVLLRVSRGFVTSSSKNIWQETVRKRSSSHRGRKKSSDALHVHRGLRVTGHF